MPNWLKQLNGDRKFKHNWSLKFYFLPLCFLIMLAPWPVIAISNDFSAKVRSANLLEIDDSYQIAAKIDYQLSPTAREALHKGIPLAWDVLLKLTQSQPVFDSTIYENSLPYQLQFHALLNQYEIRLPNGQTEMFLSLNAALNFMSNMKDVTPIGKNQLTSGNNYQLAVKTRFNREFLPVPLRPVAYLDSHWFLSSSWFIWPIQK